VSEYRNLKLLYQ